jgi:hypothetical protein
VFFARDSIIYTTKQECLSISRLSKKPFHEAAQDAMDREPVPQRSGEAAARRFRATGLRQPHLSKHLHAPEPPGPGLLACAVL